MSRAREYFTTAGKLTKPTRPLHEINLGRLVADWRLSSTGLWSELAEPGHLVQSLFQVAIVENVGGLRFTRVIAGPLCVRLAWIRRQ